MKVLVAVLALCLAFAAVCMAGHHYDDHHVSYAVKESHKVIHVPKTIHEHKVVSVPKKIYVPKTIHSHKVITTSKKVYVPKVVSYKTLIPVVHHGYDDHHY